ncbi:MAG: pilus assembly protein TadG-related protein [Actinomycetota bacterium]|nr:pilus assembly protein TadG-related protein [Actinomycetota bacterium]
MRTRFHDDQGAVAVIVAILLIVFIGLSAVVVDAGYWYTVRRQLQTAADAAALAGCQDLILDKSDAEIWATVESYAGMNAVIPANSITVIAPSSGGLSDITSDSVKVAVGTESRSFFGRVFGVEQTTIRAQANAKIGYLVAATTPMPWALPILRVTRMTASVGGGPEIPLTADPSGVWGGYLPSGATGNVIVTAYNNQTIAVPTGVPEIIDPAARIVRIPVGSRFADVSFDKTTVTAGLGERVTVTVSLTGPLAVGESVITRIDKDEVTLTAIGGNTYRGTIAPPTKAALYDTVPLDVAIVEKKKDVAAINGVATILIRRSTFPVKDVKVAGSVLPPSSSPSPYITVSLNDYEYGKVYELKVDGGAGETGNYMAVDFQMTRHEPYWTKQDPVEYPYLPVADNPSYLDYIAGTSPHTFVIHVGDTLWTKTGTGPGPSIRDALAVRFAGEAANFDVWAVNKPGSRRLIYVPVTERIEPPAGVSPLRVVSFAMFYVEDIDIGGEVLIKGRFVEYVSPGWVVSSTPPSSGLVIKAAHLVSEGLSF